MINNNLIVPPAYKAWNKNDFLGYSLNVAPHDLRKTGPAATTLAIVPSVSGRGVTQNNTVNNGLALFLPHTDINILVKFTVPPVTQANRGYIGVWFRSSTTELATDTQYVATLGTGGSNPLDVGNLAKYATGFAQNSVVLSGMTKGNKAWLRCGAVGTNIRAKWWMDGSSEPGSYQNSWTQTQIASGNYIILGTYAPGDATNRTTIEYFSYALGSSAVAPSP
jgi:hypothetical protein